MNNPIRMDAWANRLLGEQQFIEKKGFFPWWYRLTAPADLPNPTLHQRDLARRSKILSALALFLALVLVMVAYVALTGPNTQIITTVLILYPTIVLCLWLNRRGRVMVAGAILLTALVGGMYLTLLTTAYLHGGLTPNDKDILFLTWFGELVAAAFLPLAALFAVAGLNVLLNLLILSCVPHTPAFRAMLAIDASSISFRLVELHVFATAVLAIMAYWSYIALKRADRAEEVARLSQVLIEQDRAKLQEKQRLEESISNIMQVHLLVAQGDLHARVSLQEGMEDLYRIAVPLNTLLSRYQHTLQRAEAGDQAREVLHVLTHDDPALLQKATACWQHLRTRKAEQAPAPRPARS